MNSTFPMVALLVGGLTLVIGVAVLAYLQQKRRREALQALALQRGWGYTERDDRWCEAFTCQPFRSGHNRQAHNILTGMHDGREMAAFDFVYYTTETSTNAEGRTTSREESHWHAVVGLRTGAALPGLSVTPEGFFGRAIGRLLNRDIELESEDFNRAFTVQCEDRKFATDILHPRLMERLLTARDVAWSLNSGWIVSTENGRGDIAEMDRRLAVLDGVLDSIPEFVRREYGLPTEGTA